MPLDDTRHLTVSELNALVRTLVEENFPEVSVLGEVSNLKRHTSGHVYFTLKDADAQIRAVLLSVRRRAGSFPARGRDPGRGEGTHHDLRGVRDTTRSWCRPLETAGVGELELAFRRLMERLEKEGLFDAARKKTLPAYPFRIGVVTSPTGAAVRDIISTLRRRWPPAEILLYPVAVQGAQAVPDIVRALSLLPSVPDLDLIILGRGGGSLEDLWAFNEEAVARAIYACPLPVVSAVGHETDFTIADFVADVRAATPTMAAEIAVPRLDDRSPAYGRGGEKAVTIRPGWGSICRKTTAGRTRAELRARAGPEAVWRPRCRRLDYAAERLTARRGDRACRAFEPREREPREVGGLSTRREFCRAVLSVCSDARTGGVIRTAAAAVAARDVRLAFADGRVSAEVKERVDGE